MQPIRSHNDDKNQCHTFTNLLFINFVVIMLLAMLSQLGFYLRTVRGQTKIIATNYVELILILRLVRVQSITEFIYLVQGQMSPDRMKFVPFCTSDHSHLASNR